MKIRRTRIKMKNTINNYTYRKYPFNFYGLFLGFFLFILFLAVPGQAWEDRDTSETSFQRFQFEIYGGYSTLDPADFNLLARTDTQTREFIYDGYYNFLQQAGYSRSWDKMVGDYRGIESAQPAGFRLKYRLNSLLSLSLGLRVLSKTQLSDPSFRYMRTTQYWERYMDESQYISYSLSASGYTPMLGVHLEKYFGPVFGLEGHLAAGPVFARCRYNAQWHSEWVYMNSAPYIVFYEEDSSLEQEGSGTGIALETGLRLNMCIGGRFGIFVGGSYIYQSAGNFSGTGKEISNNHTTEWEGQWAMKRETLVAFWGEQLLEFPTNYWDDKTGGIRSRNFKLDLSGFQLQVGLFYRF